MRKYKTLKEDMSGPLDGVYRWWIRLPVLFISIPCFYLFGTIFSLCLGLKTFYENMAENTKEAYKMIIECL